MCQLTDATPATLQVFTFQALTVGTLEASIETAGGSELVQTVSWTITSGPVNVVSSELTVPGAVTAGGTITLALTPKDAYGNLNPVGAVSPSRQS
jgi:hypothetical protein